MTTTNYAGINYAMPGSTTNTNPKTGIRYGIIPSHSVAPEAVSDIYDNGDDLDLRDYLESVRIALKSALSDFYHGERLEASAESAFEALDDIGDTYQQTGDCVRMVYSRDGYKLETDSDGDVWCFESPFFTYAQFCSPCAPGACYLKNPLDNESPENKCYCLGKDWFDDDDAPCPYPMYSVATGQLV
jgi:hypothetical protein